MFELTECFKQILWIVSLSGIHRVNVLYIYLLKFWFFNYNILLFFNTVLKNVCIWGDCTGIQGGNSQLSHVI